MIEKDHFEDGPFFAEDLSVTCGLDIEVSFSFHGISRTFPDGSRMAGVSTGHNSLTFTANGNTVKFQQVGTSMSTTSDGTEILRISGRNIEEDGLIGHWVIDLNSGELISQAGRSVNYEQLCSRLAR